MNARGLRKKLPDVSLRTRLGRRNLNNEKRDPLLRISRKSDRRDSNPRSRPWQGRALPTTPLSHVLLSQQRHIIIFFPAGQAFSKTFPSRRYSAAAVLRFSILRRRNLPPRQFPTAALAEADYAEEAGTADKTIAARPNVPRTLLFPRPRLHIMQSRPSGNGRCVRAERERRARVLEAVPGLL